MHRRVFAAFPALALTLAACNGGNPDSTAEPATDVATTPATAPPSPADGPITLLPSQVDLLGDTVVPEAEIPSNLLPAVVLDDLSSGRKVNFRNLIPQELPVLLWMWAPS